MSVFIQVQENIFVRKSEVLFVKFEGPDPGWDVIVKLRSGEMILESQIDNTRKAHIIDGLMRSD